MTEFDPIQGIPKIHTLSVRTGRGTPKEKKHILKDVLFTFPDDHASRCASVILRGGASDAVFVKLFPLSGERVRA